jgi:uncharacterized protein (DUF1330 family)
LAAYLVVAGAVNDTGAWRLYRDAVMPLIAQFGGKPLTRGAAEVLEGSHADWFTTVFEFPTLEAIHVFWRSPEYAPVKALRLDAAVLNVWAVPGA